MGQTERMYKLKTWLDSGRCVKRDAVLRALEISPATLKRDLALLRDRLEVPIVWDKEGGGWRLDKSQSSSGMRHELPGLWFSAQELQAPDGESDRSGKNWVRLESCCRPRS